MNHKMCTGIQCPECYQIPLKLRETLLEIHDKLFSNSKEFTADDIAFMREMNKLKKEKDDSD